MWLRLQEQPTKLGPTSRYLISVLELKQPEVRYLVRIIVRMDLGEVILIYFVLTNSLVVISALSKSLYLTLYMNVQAEERVEWEAYTAEKGRVWVKESLEFQKRQGLVQEQLADNNISGMGDITFWDVIYGYDELEKPEEEQGKVGTNLTGPYLPFWQNSPLIPVDPPYK